MIQIKRLICAAGIACGGMATAADTPSLPTAEIRNFVDVYNIIKHEYVEKVESETLIDNAIQGMVSRLDPHSEYLKKDDLEELAQQTEGSYQGFGFKIGFVGSKLTVIAPIPESPAAKAGLKPNDQILKIEDTVIDEMPMSAVSSLLDEYETVNLTILRSGSDVSVVTLTKTTVVLPSITQRIIDKKYGYIRIAQFQGNTAEQFREAFQNLSSKEVQGLIIDLRNNPGGLIDAATDIANVFLSGGVIVSTKNENTGVEDKIYATDKATISDIPLVVLINEGSASASELLAGALQGHKRALIVGRKSFGKGSVQTILPLSGDYALKLTTARYYTPGGISIQAEGITPDIVLSQYSVEDKKKDLLSFSEANIPRHLDEETDSSSDESDDTSSSMETADNEQHDVEGAGASEEEIGNDGQANVSESESKEEKDAPKNITSDDLASKDFQLFEALNALKVLIFKQ